MVLSVVFDCVLSCHIMLCCVVLCYCVVSCCVMWCCIVLSCFVVLYCVVLCLSCRVVLCRVLCYIVLCCVISCRVVLCCCAVLCCAVLCHVMSCHVILCHVVLCCVVLCCVVLCCVVLHVTIYSALFQWLYEDDLLQCPMRGNSMITPARATVMADLRKVHQSTYLLPLSISTQPFMKLSLVRYLANSFMWSVYDKDHMSELRIPLEPQNFFWALFVTV